MENFKLSHKQQFKAKITLYLAIQKNELKLLKDARLHFIRNGSFSL